jgi:hypothetical protein
MLQKIVFKKQHKVVTFGDTPHPRTVDGRRLAAQKAAEMRRFNRMFAEKKNAGSIGDGWTARIMRFVRSRIQGS